MTEDARDPYARRRELCAIRDRDVSDSLSREEWESLSAEEREEIRTRVKSAFGLEFDVAPAGRRSEQIAIIAPAMGRRTSMIHGWLSRRTVQKVRNSLCEKP